MLAVTMSNHPRLSDNEKNTIHRLKGEGLSRADILGKLEQARRRVQKTGPSKSAVNRYISGETYKVGKTETRGQPSTCPRRLLRTAFAVRKRLIKKADNEWYVSWKDVHTETERLLRKRRSLKPSDAMPCQSTLERNLREHFDLHNRPAKRHITITMDDEEKRLKKAKTWRKYQKSFWKNQIHAYIDNKAFLVARTAADKKRMRQQTVHSHLRTKTEGSEKGFVAPKKSRANLGLVSLDITAAVAQNKIIMWHINAKPWNGAAAAVMYAKLGTALRKHWGNKKFFRVVEDGDRKGFQSNKGIAAKKKEKIKSWLLPPRTPEWMPLDFSLWKQIESKVLAKPIKRTETVKAYAARLQRTATRLSKEVVANTLGDMRPRILETVEQKGGHLKQD